jgi:DNA-binding XRE family transcriptional regulator
MEEKTRQEDGGLLREELFGKRVFFKPGTQRWLFRTVRERMGWTKAKMAEYLGISDTALYTYEMEDSRRHPTWEVIEKTLFLAPEFSEEVLKSIHEVKPMHWGSQKGIATVNRTYGVKLAEWGRKGGKKGIRVLMEKYPDKLHEWRRLAGKKGAQVMLAKHRDKLPEWGRKGMAVIIEKYPNKLREWSREGAERLAEKYRDKLSEWGKKGAEVLNSKFKDRVLEGVKKGHRKGALHGAERQKPTAQMKWLREENRRIGLVEGVDFRVNYTIKCKDNFRNFDFTYFKDGEPRLVEEDTAALPYRHRMVQRAYQLVSAKRWLLSIGRDMTYLLVLSSEGRDSRGYTIRVQPDVILGLIDEGVIPCFYHGEWLKLRKGIIREAISSWNCPSGDIPEYLGRLRDWAFTEIRDREQNMLKCSRAEKNSEMDPLEKTIHENLCDLGFKPKGKTIVRSTALRNEFGIEGSTYMVVDNSFHREGRRWYVQVSAANTVNSLRSCVQRHAGYFWLLKKMYDLQARCMSVIFLNDNMIKLQERGEIIASRMFTDGTIFTKFDDVTDSVQRFFHLGYPGSLRSHYS